MAEKLDCFVVFLLHLMLLRLSQASYVPVLGGDAHTLYNGESLNFLCILNVNVWVADCKH